MKTDKINSSSTTAKEPKPSFSQNELRMTDEEMIVYLSQFPLELLEAVARIVVAQETVIWSSRKTTDSH